MSFQVNFGSTPSLASGGDSARKRGGSRPGGRPGSASQPNQDSRHHRGRGGRGRDRRGSGGKDTSNRENDDEEVGSDDSDGASSVSSESRGGRGRGQWRGRSRGGRGRRGKQRNDNGRSGFEKYSSSSDLRSPSEEKPATQAQQEIHIHYHTPYPAAQQFQQMPVPNLSQPPSLAQPNLQPYFSQPGLQPPSYVCLKPQESVQYPYSTSNTQPSSTPYPSPPPSFGEAYPNRPLLANPRDVPPPLIQPGPRPLLNKPPSLFALNTRDGHSVPESYSAHNHEQNQRQRVTGADRSFEAQRGSRQDLSQRSGKNAGQKPKVDDKSKKGGDGKKGEHGSKSASSSESDQKRGKNAEDSKQLEKAVEAKISPAIPDVDPDEWIKIFKLLLQKFSGRTKFGTLMSQRELFKSLSHAQAAAWLKHSNRFLTFEKEGKVKFVSIYFKEARICFKYRKHNTDKCQNENCTFFHICRDFVAGSCPRQEGCHFNHSFHSKTNAKVCAEVGLQAFTDEEIRIIVFRSTPIVCEKFNKGICNEDCPDLHVCSRFIRNECSKEDCELGHSIKGTEHNLWIFETFHMQKIPEAVLLKMTITQRNSSITGNDASGKPQTTSTSAGREAIQKKTKDKTPLKTTSQSKESLLDAVDLPKQTDPQQKTKNKPVDKEPRRERALPPSKKNDSSDKNPSSVDVSPNLSALRNLNLKKSTQQETEGSSPGGQGGARSKRRGQQKRGETGEPNIRTPEGDRQHALSAYLFTYLCEDYTWTGECSRKHQCPRYHHPNRKPYVWQIQISGEWKEVYDDDSREIEERFCAHAIQWECQVMVDSIGVLHLRLDFSAMTAVYLEAYVDQPEILKIRRWSTPSYVEAETTTPLNLCTQWIWIWAVEGGTVQPFAPGSLQYTLEEKYCNGQQNYYFEDQGNRFLLLLQEMQLECLSTGDKIHILRRPIFQDKEDVTPEMPPLLLDQPPDAGLTNLPGHWCSLDHHQDFEMVRLDVSSSEHKDVERSFHSTLSRDHATIVHIFRIQNPSLWDKYCSAKRTMALRNRSEQDVDERRLFHGTPTLQAVHGICINNMDFRRSGENVGALYGRGSYFSAHASYSHSYTNRPDRYMFLAKVLVGKFTKGQESYQKPPERDGHKLYDSCVDNENNPSIFVIFDLAQSYPEYLIEYKDAHELPAPGTHGTGARPKVKPVLSVVSSKSDAQRPVPVPRPRTFGTTYSVSKMVSRFEQAEQNSD